MRIPPCGDYGDVDADGYVTEEDASAAARHYYGTDLFPDGQLGRRAFARADVNSDGVVTMEDAAAIANYASGNIDTFPGCTTYGRRGAGIVAALAVLVILYILMR